VSAYIFGGGGAAVDRQELIPAVDDWLCLLDVPRVTNGRMGAAFCT